MIVSPGLRRAALVAHVATSVGWLGAVAAFLALAIAGQTSADAVIVRAAYVAMDLITWFVIVPLSIASLLTGVLQSLLTKWGLFQYSWVVAKLALSTVATVVLLIKTQPITHVATAAAQTVLSSADYHQLRTELLVHAGGGLVLLLAISTLSVFKPWGRTRYGRRALEERQSRATALRV